MKVLIATGLYPPEIGGPATYIKMLEEYLPQHGIDLIVIPFGEVRKYPKIIRHVVYAYKLWKASKGSDIIYALDPVSVGVPALIVSKLRHKPFLLRLGGDYAWEQGRQRFGMTASLDKFSDNPKQYGFRIALLSWAQTVVVDRAVTVIVPSDYLGSIVGKWGVDLRKIRTVYSALHPLPVNQEREILRKELLFTYPTIVSAGRLVPWKGFVGLVEATAELRSYFPTITLVIVGDGPYKKEIEAAIKKYGLEQNVRLIGSKSKEALGAVVAAADVFVLNTAYEGLSHQLLEVMDIGTPIVTTSVGGNCELVSHNINGLLINYDDVDQLSAAVKRILSEEGLVSKLSFGGKERVQEFKIEVVVDRIVALLHDVYGK